MSNAVVALIAVVWLSLVVLAALFFVSRSPRRRKPVDELEAADAALRNRVVDLEDKFESYVKREAVRGMRARKEEAAVPQQEELPLTKEELARRWAAQKGARRGFAG